MFRALLVCFVGFTCAAASAAATVSFDKIYQSASNGDSWGYFLFLPDGTVYAVEHNGPPREAAQILRERKSTEKGVSQGQYETQQTSITIRFKSREYVGTILPVGDLVLDDGFFRKRFNVVDSNAIAAVEVPVVGGFTLARFLGLMICTVLVCAFGYLPEVYRQFSGLPPRKRSSLGAEGPETRWAAVILFGIGFLGGLGGVDLLGRMLSVDWMTKLFPFPYWYMVGTGLAGGVAITGAVWLAARRLPAKPLLDDDVEIDVEKAFDRLPTPARVCFYCVKCNGSLNFGDARCHGCKDTVVRGWSTPARSFLQFLFPIAFTFIMWAAFRSLRLGVPQSYFLVGLLIVGGGIARSLVSSTYPSARIRLMGPSLVRSKTEWRIDEDTWNSRRSLSLHELVSRLTPADEAAKLLRPPAADQALAISSGSAADEQLDVFPPTDPSLHTVIGSGVRADAAWKIASAGTSRTRALFAVCPNCQIKVVPMAHGTCPSCGRPLV